MYYEYLGDDLEQMNQDELQSFFELFGQRFNRVIKGKAQKLFGKMDYVKCYCWNKKVYFESTYPLELGELTKVENLHQCLFDLKEPCSDIQLKNDTLYYQDRYFRLIHLCEFAPELSPSVLMDFDYVTCFYKVDSRSSKAFLEQLRKVEYANRQGHLDNLESQINQETSTSVLEDLYNGKEELFQVESWVIVQAYDLETLGRKTSEVLHTLENLRFIPMVETYALGSIFQQILPGSVPLFKKTRLTPSSYLQCILPLQRDLIHQEGLSFYSRSGGEVKLDLFHPSSHNFNVNISGYPGSGKSVLGQKLILEGLEKNYKAMVFDLGHSFKNLAHYEKALVYSQGFNPYRYKTPSFQHAFILSVLPPEFCNHKTQALLYKELVEHLKNPPRNFRTLIETISHTIKDLDLYFSEYWEFFTEHDESADFIYVDTTLYPKKILSPLLLYLIETFKNMQGRKIFLFDECWHLLNSHSEYLEESFRTFRKHNASAIAISQNFDDFTRSHIGRIIVDCSFYKILLPQQCEGSGFLNEFDQEMVSSLRSQKRSHSEFYLKTDFNKKVLRYYPSPLEYELFTTDPHDKEVFGRYQQKHQDIFDYPDLLHRWVRYKYDFDNSVSN